MLKLRIAMSFADRLLGIHRFGGLQPNEGLLLVPCWCIHTFTLRQRIDVVFLDADGREVRCVADMPPRRVAGILKARMVLELPAGYCAAHDNYMEHIHAALRQTRLLG